MKQEIELLNLRILEYEERENNQRKMFDKFIQAFENNDKPDESQKLIEAANAHLRNPLYSHPLSSKDKLDSPAKSADAREF